jgi:hypothetical protein
MPSVTGVPSACHLLVAAASAAAAAAVAAASANSRQVMAAWWLRLRGSLCDAAALHK